MPTIQNSHEWCEKFGWPHIGSVLERSGDTPCERRLWYNAGGTPAVSEEEIV